MGFNNEGLAKIVENLKKSPHKVIIGGNIGKNTNTLPENYTADYVECFRGLHDFVDYFVSRQVRRRRLFKGTDYRNSESEC